MSVHLRQTLIGKLLILCICGTSAQAIYDCSSVSCHSNQTCSPYDGECYDRFTTNDFVFSYWSEDTQYGTFDCDNFTRDFSNISALFDSDNSTSFQYKRDYHRVINLTFSENVWIHKITILVENRNTLWTTYIFNDDFANYADACGDPGDDREFWSDAFEWSEPDDSNFDGYAVAEYTNSADSNSIGDDFPFMTQFLGIGIYHYKNAWISAINVYGSYHTPAPTAEPTLAPSVPTTLPTTVPSTHPSVMPTTQPTEYPTDPGICIEYPNVTQPCCGHFNHSVEEQEVNLRNASLDTCIRKFTDSCCGTEGTYSFSGDELRCHKSAGWTDSNSNHSVLSAVLCDPDDYNVSQNSDVVGTIISGELYYLSDDFLPCTCMYTVYECEGTDEATCRGDDLCDDLFDEECWDSDSDSDTMMTTMMRDSCDTNWFSNETCYEESVDENWAYSSLQWEPCSASSFIGDVSNVTSISNERLDVSGDVCECTYNVVDCRLTSDPASEAGSCDDHDCDSGGCYEQEVRPCCGYDRSDRFNHSFNIVSPQFDDYGYPIDDSWTCDNGVDELCPDVKGGTRLYNATSKVGWFYNGTDIVDQCTCLYFYDECDVPTVSPTAAPTVIPTEEPTSKPTEIDSNEESVDGSQGVVLGVTVMIVVISFASIYVV